MMVAGNLPVFNTNATVWLEFQVLVIFMLFYQCFVIDIRKLYRYIEFEYAYGMFLLKQTFCFVMVQSIID